VGEREGVDFVVREEVGAWGRNDPNVVYAHMNNNTIIKKKE
jgi:hypothetical protein